MNTTISENNTRIGTKYDTTMAGVQVSIPIFSGGYVNKGFMAGTRNHLDILNTEQNLAVARRDLNRGRYQSVLARLKLLSLADRLDWQAMTMFNDWLDTK